MSDLSLWHVKIDEKDWEYDRFESAVVWAATPEDAEAIVRAEIRLKAEDAPYLKADELWVGDTPWRLIVTPAPTEGVALVHWHTG